jgi:hypothetical protein
MKTTSRLGSATLTSVTAALLDRVAQDLRQPLPRVVDALHRLPSPDGRARPGAATAHFLHAHGDAVGQIWRQARRVARTRMAPAERHLVAGSASRMRTSTGGW